MGLACILKRSARGETLGVHVANHHLRATQLNRAAKLLKLVANRHYRTALVRHGCAAAVEHSSVLRMADYRTVVDIGANRGQFALATRQCLPRAQVVSFEPLQDAADRFNGALGQDPRVTLHVAAIGDDSGQALIHISKKDHSSSLLPITAVQQRLFRGTAERGTTTVRVGRLSEFMSADEVEQPAMLKLDVQGYEIEALKGCEEFLPHFATILVEGSFMELYEGQPLADELVSWLLEQRFRFSGVYNPLYDGIGRAIQADFLFANLGS